MQAKNMHDAELELQSPYRNHIPAMIIDAIDNFIRKSTVARLISSLSQQRPAIYIIIAYQSTMPCCSLTRYYY